MRQNKIKFLQIWLFNPLICLSISLNCSSSTFTSPVIEMSIDIWTAAFLCNPISLEAFILQKEFPRSNES